MSEAANDRNWGPLSAAERRVLGVLIEKAKTTPDGYPLTLQSATTACNQKSARDPLTNYDTDDVDETLQSLRKKGAAIMVDAGGRVLRYKHSLYDWIKVSKVEAAVLAELFLRGAQTEGDLRARASRMEPLPDLATLQEVLKALETRGMVVYLTPPGTRRGVIVTHGFSTPEALERERQKHSQTLVQSDTDDFAPPPASSPTRAAGPIPPTLIDEVALMKLELDRQAELIRLLTEEVRALKSALGA